MVRAEVQNQDGTWRSANFLLDIGADRTVFHADLLEFLQLDASLPGELLEGVGGLADAVTVETRIRFTTDDGGDATFSGRFAAFTDPDALDMSVLGRNITNVFAVIVDRPRDVVCLLGQRHSYTIIES